MNSLHGINHATADTSSHLQHLNSPAGSPLFEHLGERKSMSAPNADNIMLNLKEGMGAAGLVENQNIDVGWTYFGQFISHDLTMRRELGITQPRLNLDCLYGFGPVSNAHLYESVHKTNSDIIFKGVRFIFDPYFNDRGDKVDDVPRVGPDMTMPLMGDVRNDENFLLNQLHCTFMGFHNKMAEFFSRENLEKPEKLFNRTRKFVTWTYQWLIINEYMKLLTGDLADALIRGCERFKILSIDDRYAQEPILMPEFSVAAFRMGHSQVRSTYRINQLERLDLLTDDFASKSDLRGYIRDPRRGPVDWRYFFKFGEVPATEKSKPIDLAITLSLRKLSFPDRENRTIDLSQTNIERSVRTNMVLRNEDLSILRDRLGINTIKDFAAALSELNFEKDNASWQQWETCKENLIALDGWPLWIFILIEARVLGVQEKGLLSDHVKQRLGPLGAQIVAEQIVWVLRKDKTSYLHSPLPWNPMQVLENYYAPVNKDRPATFSIADVINIAQYGIYN